MASQVLVNSSEVPDRPISTPVGRPCFSRGAMTSLRTISIAASSGRCGAGRISSVTVRTLSRWRISVGPEVTSISASEVVGRILPSGVTMGSAPIPWVSVTLSWGPLSVRSMRFPSTVTSTIRRPSLKASTVRPRSVALISLSARRTGSGVTRISGAPSSSPGRGRSWLPSANGI